MTEENKDELDLLGTTGLSIVDELQSQLPASWKYKSQSVGLENIRRSTAMMRTKHGMYSGIPIVCKGSDCPYRKTCWIEDADLEVGGRCPIEIGAILSRFESYVTELNIEEDNYVDLSIVKDIIDIEVMMLRAENALAISGDFIQEVIAGADNKGRPLFRPELHKAFEAKSKLRAERTKLLNQLNSTRRDKKEESKVKTDPSTVAAQLLMKMKKLQEEGRIIDIVPSNEGE